ncbi:MAG: hypothetical protein H7123_08575 [Thermoleophilia bacterium]|nr:hypothetical protein [Thermoleophilia bacterium]
MRRIFEYGGYIAGIILIAFGIGALAMSINARNEVRSNLAAERIIGTPDSSISGKLVDTGARARTFAKVMRKHTLEATGGRTYAEMGQFLTSTGKETSDSTKAAIDPVTTKSVPNPARNIWVTETALSTALNTAYMAENLALFGIVVGIALLLSGFGFMILTGFSRLHKEVAHHVMVRDESRVPTGV